MERTKVLLIIGLGLILTLPLVCWLDKPSKKKDTVELTEKEKQEQEKEKVQEEERRIEREKEKKEEAKREAYRANMALKVNLVEKLEAVFGSEWDAVPEVGSDGSIEISRRKKEGYEICKFHVTGVTATQKDGYIILNGAITRYVSGENNDEFVPISSLKVSRNPALPGLLEKFRTAVMEGE